MSRFIISLIHAIWIMYDYDCQTVCHMTMRCYVGDAPWPTHFLKLLSSGITIRVLLPELHILELREFSIIFQCLAINESYSQRIGKKINNYVAVSRAPPEVDHS